LENILYYNKKTEVVSMKRILATVCAVSMAFALQATVFAADASQEQIDDIINKVNQSGIAQDYKEMVSNYLKDNNLSADQVSALKETLKAGAAGMAATGTDNPLEYIAENPDAASKLSGDLADRKLPGALDEGAAKETIKVVVPTVAPPTGNTGSTGSTGSSGSPVDAPTVKETDRYGTTIATTTANTSTAIATPTTPAAVPTTAPATTTAPDETATAVTTTVTPEKEVTVIKTAEEKAPEGGSAVTAQKPVANNNNTVIKQTGANLDFTMLNIVSMLVVAIIGLSAVFARKNRFNKGC
jgi:predicted transcriptional regulator